MRASDFLRFAIYSLASLAVDSVLVGGFLLWNDDLELMSFLLGVVVIWAVRLAVGLRNTLTRAVYYMLGHASIIDQMVQHMRLKQYPRDVAAYNWFSYAVATAQIEDLPREVAADIAATTGSLAGMRQASILAGAIHEHLVDRAIARYLA